MSSVTKCKEYLGGRRTKSKQTMSMWTFNTVTTITVTNDDEIIKVKPLGSARGSFN